MDALQVVFGGIAAILGAAAALVTALRRATRAVQDENAQLVRQLAEHRQWRDKASGLIYRLLGVVERGEPYDEHLRADHDALLEIGRRIDERAARPVKNDSPTPESGDRS